MTSILGSSRAKASSSSDKTSNTPNLTDLENKVQNFSLLRGFVAETRPGGDVIVETSKGQIRAQSDTILEEGAQVRVRITTSSSGEKRAFIVQDSSENTYATQDSIKPSVANYIKNIFFGGNLSNLKRNMLNARFTYISPNVKVLDFGHINLQSPIRIEIIDPDNINGKTSILNGSIISNDAGRILVNTEIGILNIDAKSSVEAGQKILINIIDSFPKDKVLQIKNLIEGLFTNIGQNLSLLREIIAANKNIASKHGYKSLLKLFLSPHDTAILAKIFRQTGEVPASEVSKWIENDIVKPFKDAAKNYRLGLLTQQMNDIRSLLEEAKIMADSTWHEILFTIPGTDQETILNVKREKENVQFKLETIHPDFGKILLNGLLALNMTQNSISNFDMKIKYSEEFPEMLISNLQSIFKDHIATSNIKGNIEFGLI